MRLCRCKCGRPAQSSNESPFQLAKECEVRLTKENTPGGMRNKYGHKTD